MRSVSILRPPRAVGLTVAAFVAAALVVAHAAPVFAQEGEQRAGQTRSVPPIRHAGAAALTEQQAKGAGLFFQRCSLCHLAKTTGAGGSKYCCVAALAPDLAGRFADVTADEEKAFKDIILNGGPTYMPSWRYSLTPEEIDDVIAYLKTLG